ncbi:hypothetical protein A2U01_0084250, partial [Trifolium medium]|nr:hypothetical protein [Trifolium medium]
MSRPPTVDRTTNPWYYILSIWKKRRRKAARLALGEMRVESV